VVNKPHRARAISITYTHYVILWWFDWSRQNLQN